MNYPTRTDLALFSATEQLVQIIYGDLKPAEVAQHRRQWKDKWLQALSQGGDPTVPFELTFPVDGPAQTPHKAFPISTLELMLTSWPDTLLAWGLDSLTLKQPLSEVVFPGLQALFYTKLRRISDSDIDVPPLHRGIFKWSEGGPRLNPRFPRLPVGVWEVLGGRLFGNEKVGPSKGNPSLLQALEAKGVLWDAEAKQALVAQVFKFSVYGTSWNVLEVPAFTRQLIGGSPIAWWTTPLAEDDLSYFTVHADTLAAHLLAYFDTPTPLKEVLQAKQLEVALPEASTGQPSPRM